MSDAPVQIQLSGDTDVKAAFAQLRAGLPLRLERQALKRGASLLQGLIVLVAPVLTGRLRRNIEVHTHKGPSTIRARVTVNTEGGRDDQNNAFYWRFLERGFHRAGRFIIKPFIGPVFNSQAARVAQFAADDLDQELKRAEQRAQRG